MKIILTGLAGLVCVCLISQAASGFEPKIPLSNIPLVVLSDCGSGYLVKNCGNSQGTIKQTKGYAINLKESLSMDSSDKKKDTKPTKTKETKQTKTKEKKLDTKKLKEKDLKKKFEKVKEKLKAKKKLTTSSKQNSAQKTKHDTAQNSIGNMR